MIIKKFEEVKNKFKENCRPIEFNLVNDYLKENFKDVKELENLDFQNENELSQLKIIDLLKKVSE